VVTSSPSAILSPKNCTPTTPTLSEALAVIFTVPRTVAPSLGEVMLTVGGVVSPEGGGGGGGGGGALATVTVTGAEVN